MCRYSKKNCIERFLFMFWFGWILALFGTILKIESIKKYILSKTKTSSRTIVRCLNILSVVGLILSGVVYTYDKIDSNKQKSEITKLQFNEIMKYNVYGNFSSKTNGVPAVRSPIQDWGYEYVISNDDRIDCKCDSIAIQKYHEVISILPNYPFPYFFLAKCYKDVDDPIWIDYADKADAILKITTEIQGHHSQQDIIYDQLLVLRQ